MQRRYQETQSDWIRVKLGSFITQSPCPECGGKRLRKEALGVTVDEKNIIEVTQLPVDQLLDWVNRLESQQDTPLKKRDQAIAERILREIQARLTFLTDVGLDYLTLERSASTLSGGEAQRIRLANPDWLQTDGRFVCAG